MALTKFQRDILIAGLFTSYYVRGTTNEGFYSERDNFFGTHVLARLFLFSFFPCSADHERDWPPFKVVFFGLATNTLNECEKQHFFPLTAGDAQKV